MQNIIIFGASGHGSVILDCLEKQKEYNVVGFLDSFKKKGAKINGYEVLGSEYDLPYIIKTHNVIGGIVAIGDNWIRKMMVDRILKIEPEFHFVSTVHPNTTIGANVTIGEGTAVMPGVIVNANATIGNHCILNTYASLDHDGFMGTFSSLAPRVCTGGNFILGEGSAICLGTNIIENITIGKYTVVGAGSLVVANIEGHVLAYGTPAKKIRHRNSGEIYLSGNNYSPVIHLIAKKAN